MEDKDTSNLTHPKEKPVNPKFDPEYKPKTYKLEEFKLLFKNGRNS